MTSMLSKASSPATKRKILLVTVPVTIVADLATKVWVSGFLAESERRVVVDGIFSITHGRNPGVAFGLLSSIPGVVRPWILGALVIAAIALIMRLIRTAARGDRTNAFALGLILGGAIGNLIDRVMNGAVLDFLHFELFGRHSTPSFNLADVFIVTGVGTLIFELVASEAARRSRSDDAC